MTLRPDRRAATIALLVLATPAAAAPRLTEPAVRAFTARQEAAWNARDVRGWTATFTPDAVFVDQAKNSNGGVTSNGSSTLAQAAAQARRFFAGPKFAETAAVDRVEIAPDGRSARLLGRAVTEIAAGARPARRLCAETSQTVVLVAGRILSKGQTETGVRCPR